VLLSGFSSAGSQECLLKASKEVNGYPRAGDAGDGLVVVDIDQLVRYSLPPRERGLLETVRGGLRYWVMRPREE
jgi:hypothetical protein